MDNYKLARQLVKLAKSIVAEATYTVWTTAGTSLNDPDVVIRTTDKAKAEKTLADEKKKYPKAEHWITKK